MDAADRNGPYVFGPQMLVGIAHPDKPLDSALLPGIALIDTGSDCSAVSQLVATTLDLEVIDERTPQGLAAVTTDVVRFAYRLPNDECRYVLEGIIWPTALPPFVAMILGMDVLRRCRLEINGYKRTFALHWRCMGDH